MSEKFLNRLNDTYVGDYIPNKLRLLNANYNESNIQNVFDNISNYYKLIIDIEKAFEIYKADNSNKVLESLGNEFKNTLENFKLENGNLNGKMIKIDINRNSEINYSNEIKQMSENLINNMQRTQNMRKTSKKIPS